jgi:hypothetical protein
MDPNEKAPSGGTLQGFEKHVLDTQGYSVPTLPAIETVVRIALEEIDRLRALQIVPDEDLLLERLQSRIGDYRLIQAAVVRFLTKVR